MMRLLNVVLLTAVLFVMMSSTSWSESGKSIVCKRAETAQDAELKQQWQELCKRQQLHELREAQVKSLEENAARQRRLSKSIDDIVWSSFCTGGSRPYPYLCQDLGQ